MRLAKGKSGTNLRTAVLTGADTALLSTAETLAAWHGFYAMANGRPRRSVPAVLINARALPALVVCVILAAVSAEISIAGRASGGSTMLFFMAVAVGAWLLRSKICTDPLTRQIPDRRRWS